MKKRKNILRNHSGETIIEVIVAIGIVLIALFAFSTCVVISGKINNEVASQDKELYENIAEAQARNETTLDSSEKPCLNMKEIEDTDLDIQFEVNIYGTDIKSFSLKEEETP